MSVFTFFPALIQQIADDNVPGFVFSGIAPVIFQFEDRHDTLYYETERLTLATAITRSIVIPGYASTENYLFYVWCNGEVQLKLTAKDYNNSTTINSINNIYGTAAFPGILALSTYNVTAISVTGVATTSDIEVYCSVICPSTDSRLITNA